MEVSGRRDGDEKYPSSILRSSDDGDQLYCLPCQHDGHQVPAYGYCQDCAEHLCESCYKVHTKPSPCRNHILLDNAHMPKVQGPSKLRPPHDLTETCQHHRGKVIEYFCKDHKVLGCSPCMTMNHRNCKIDYIPDVSKSYIESPEYQELLHGLQLLYESLQAISHSAKENKKRIQENLEKVKLDIKRLRQEINTKLDDWEAEINKEVESHFSGQRNKSESAKNQCQEMVMKIEAQQNSFKTLEQGKKYNMAFIQGKQQQESVEQDKKSEKVLKQETKRKSKVTSLNQIKQSKLF